MADDVSALLLQAVTMMQQQQQQSRPAENQTVLQQHSVIAEHRRLFGRRRPPVAERPAAENPPGGKKTKSTRTWSHQFCALALKSQSKVPTRDECTKLSRGGLGIRQLTFQSDDNSSAVNDNILSTFTPLKDGGGFELLILKSGSKTALNSVSVGPMDVAQLRFLTSGRIYIRPLQQDVLFSAQISGFDDSFMQDCITCGETMRIVDIPLHRRTVHSESTSDDELPTSGLHEWLQSANSSAVGDTAAVATLNVVNNGLPNNNAIGPLHEDSGAVDGVGLHEGVSVDMNNFGQTVSDANEPKTLQQCIDEVAALDEQDPVALLRAFQRSLMYGRPLNLTSLTETIEGQTIPLYVDRCRLLTTAFDELLTIFSEGCDFRKPLDVTFYAEQAVDLGGPRMEFFTLCLKELLSEEVGIFEKTDEGFSITCRESLLEKQFYFLAGLVCGISAVQGGPMPAFLHPTIVDKLVLNTGPMLMTLSVEQFSKGLNVIGLIDVMKHKPAMVFLLRSTCEQPISFRKLLLLLNPVFSETGSNTRARENEAYRVFVGYVREVSAGRRQPVTIGKILKFVTGCETEPVLGFSLQPRMEFQEDLSIPHANTCICTLRIPMLVSSYNLELLDLAFTSDYFGYV